jgi:hypothetical protein
MSSSRFDLSVKKDFGIQLSEAQLRLQRTKAHHSSNHDVPTDNRFRKEKTSIELTESQSTVSTAAKSGDDENSAIMLRKVLNSTNKRNNGSSNAEQKARLRKILEKKSGRSRTAAKESPVPVQQATRSNNPYAATSSTAALRSAPIQEPTAKSSSYGASRSHVPQSTTIAATKSENSASTRSSSKEDQKVLLRKMMAKARAKRQNAIEKRISPRSSLMQSQRTQFNDTRTEVRTESRHADPKRASSLFDQPPPMLAYSKAQQLPVSPRSRLMQSQKRKSTSAREPLVSKKEPLRRESIAAPVPRRESPSKPPDRARKSGDESQDRARKSGEVFSRRAPPPRAIPVQKARSDFDRISPAKLKLPDPEEDLDSYTAFFSVLQKEGVGDHRELWRSFRSVFKSGETKLLEKKKRIKFDSKTKKELTEMNLHLKRTSEIECKAETQLVNDKKFAKLGSQMLQSRQPSKLDRESLQQFQQGAVSHDTETRSEASSMHRSVESAAHPPEVEVEPPIKLRHVEVAAPKVEKKGPKSFLASFNAKQKKKNAMPPRVEETEIEVTTHRDVVPPSRQPSWLTAHREEKELGRSEAEAAVNETAVLSPVRRSADEGDLSPASLSGRKRPMREERPAAVPWAKVQLRSTGTTLTPDRNPPTFGTPAFKKVQLRDTHRLSYDGPNQVDEETPDENDAPEPEHSRPLESPSEPVMPTRESRASYLPTKPAHKNSHTVQSFVPTATEGAKSWSRVKLRRSGGGGESSLDRREAESTASAPWLNVKLRKTVDAKPEVEEKSADVSYLQVLRKTHSESDEHDDSYRPVVEPEAQAKLSKSDALNPLANMFAARNAPPKDESETDAPAEEASQGEIKNALNDMFVARICPPAASQTESEENSAEKTSKSDAKNALNNMFAARLAPPTQETKQGEKEVPGEKPSASEIKNALSNMFAARLAPPVPQEKVSTTDRAIKVGDAIDLNNLSVELQTLLANFLSVELWGIPGMPSEEVVLGKELIIIGTSEATKKRVTWCLVRDSIESITLDMARNVADLLLSDDTHKSLRFKNVEGCLRFASCFYQAPIAAATEAVSYVERPPVEPVAVVDTPSRSGDKSDQEQLSQEEQHLLMRYREARKVKGPDDAMKETMGNDAPGPVLSEDEQTTVDKYRKMLKMRIPAEAVQHKMTKDGVDPKLVELVLNPDAGASSVSKTPSTPEGNGLAPEEQTIADKYLKMLKMRIPPAAVEHKMVKEGVDQNIMDIVLNGKAKEEQTPLVVAKPKEDLSEEDAKFVSSYRKMLKMCIPTEAVRHRMKKDQVSSKVLFAVFPEDAKLAEASASASSTSKPSLNEAEQKIAATYQKMLKMRIPPEAVRHKMAKEGIDPKIVSVVLGEDPKPAKSSNGLTAEESKAVESFKKMVKIHFPEEAIRHKMKKEGTSQKVIAAVFGGDKKVAATEEKCPGKGSALRGSKLVALHWTPLSGEELDNSVWRANKKRKVTTAEPETNDISKLIELFKKKSNPKGGAVAATTTSANSSGKAKLIDLNRANNVAISLKAFKDFTHKQLAETIAHLDPQDLITGERIQFIQDILPTTREGQSVLNYKGDESRLVAAEHFFKHVVPVKRIEVKVEIMQTMVSFRTNASLLAKNFQVLERACNQVQSSEKLTDVLDMVLHVGNIMNEGTRTGGASGFKFDSLLKLTQTKSSDGKTTVLDYLVMIFVAKNKRETLDIKSDFQDCQTGSRMLVSDMNGEVQSMTDALKKCKSELTSLKKQTGKIVEEEPVSKAAPPADARAGLFAAIKSTGEDDNGEKAKQPSKRGAANSYLEAIKAKQDEEKKAEQEARKPGRLNLGVIKNKCALKAENEVGSTILKAITSCTNPGELDEEDSKASSERKAEEAAKPPPSPEKPKREATIDGGIQKLEDFIAEADETLKKLKENKDGAINSCKALSKYCGEGGGEKAATSLLGILFQFATNLSDAVKKYDKRLELEAKREAQNKKMEQQKRRKNFVESKGFGNIVRKDLPPKSTKKEPSVDGVPLMLEVDESAAALVLGANEVKLGPVESAETDLHQAAPAFDASQVKKSVEADLHQAPAFDPSQVQGDAKAKVVPKSKDGSSLVLMVSHLLQGASPQAKMDFENGVVYDDVEDETLKAIYEKERTSLSTTFRSPPRRKTFSSSLDILSAIKQRRQSDEDDSATVH